MNGPVTGAGTVISRSGALPIRWKLAITVRALTFVILTLFATVIGLFAGRQVRAGFDDDLRLPATDMQDPDRRSPPTASSTSTPGIDATC